MEERIEKMSKIIHDIKSENTTIDMKSIRTNDNGDYVFDISTTDKTGQQYAGYVEMKYNQYTIDTISEWYHLNYGINREAARKFLEDLHREGRDKLLAKYKSDKDLHEFSINTMACEESKDTTIWTLTVYDKK